MTSFVDARSMLEAGPVGLTHAVERTLWHLGFLDVRVVDGRDDGGADILGVRGNQQWIVQVKWSGRGAIDRAGVDDCERAKVRYAADNCVLATNVTLNRAALQRRRTLAQVGINVDVWDGATIGAIFARMPQDVPGRPLRRPYQDEAVAAITKDLASRRTALLVLATGLGKTLISGEVIRNHLGAHPSDRVLVLAHLRELVDQLERALWKHITKYTPTQILTGDERPNSFDGVTVATVDSALRLVTTDGYSPDLIVIDETHHVSASGMYQRLLDSYPNVPRLGVTATPWRGDKFDITDRFGTASYRMGIEDGMRAGYLAMVDYRLFVDNLDWGFVREQSRLGYSLRELNSKLFLPQRDGAIVDELRGAWQELSSPRAIVFCQSIEHAERMANLFALSDPAWRRAAAIHSGLSRQKRQVILNSFRLGRTPLLAAVDVFNEGLDVPDVNLIAFLRVTHSRRIFVQQLGRGLRLREGKDKLLVLDFVSDLRRVAAVLNLRRSLDAAGEAETMKLPSAVAHSIQFTDARAGSLLDAWIRDAADLETLADEVRLQFPEVPVGVY